ncbi:MAG: AAA family ATPase [Gammaproteobacteria bacterium RIFCSPHIGHO2_12_FULL_45_9]|nr:MAG: AAA family ATPase [Gammaproteobacteria bacterium RIFCSPHIGHO2_12_FULL_45_9]
MSTLYPRLILPHIQTALQDTPAILINGPRQSGKTTLIRHLMTGERRYLTLDDDTIRLTAQQDPLGLIHQLDYATLDEIQRAPELLLAIKKSIDEDRRPGRFLLTGSANVMVLPTVADSLAGRMEILTLLPFAQCELQADTTAACWIDHIFNQAFPTSSDPTKSLSACVIQGGYPEAIARHDPKRRKTWIRQYLDAIIQRDVKDIAHIEKQDQLPLLLKVLAQTAGQLCNYSQLGGQIGLDHKTTHKYVTIFENLFLLRRLPAWSGNHLTSLIRTPKLQFLDSGLLSILLNFHDPIQQRPLWGKVLENFIFAELTKHMTWAEETYQLFYYRDKEQVEVDFILENENAEIIGIEVKAAMSITRQDTNGLKKLAQQAPDQFKMGIVLYAGTETLPLGTVNGRGLWAVPIATLW